MKSRNAEWFARAVLVVTLVVAGWSWGWRPTQIFHWDIAGHIDGYGSKFVELYLMPMIALAGYTFIGAVANTWPEKFEGRAMSPLSYFKLAYVLVMAGIVGVVVANVCGVNTNMNYVVFPLLAFMMIASINLVVQLSRLKASKTSPRSGI